MDKYMFDHASYHEMLAYCINIKTKTDADANADAEVSMKESDRTHSPWFKQEKPWRVC